MPGISYVDDDAVYLEGVGADVAQGDNARGWYVLMENEPRAMRNVVDTTRALKKIGAPVVGAMLTTFTVGNRFSTGMSSTPIFTFAAVIEKHVPAASAALISAFSSGAGNDMLALTTAGQIRCYAEVATGNTQVNQSLAAIADGERFLAFGSCDGANVRVGYVAGDVVTSSSVALSASRAATNVNALQIGGSLETGTFTGGSTMGSAHIWGDRALLNADLLELRDWLQDQPAYKDWGLL